MKRTPKNFLKMLIALSFILGILSACNGGADKSNEVVVALAGDPVTLDPQNTRENLSNVATTQIYENLVAFNEEMEIVPRLATEWTSSNGDLEWTFTLREGVKFHDGTDFNAEAVKKSFERVTKEDNNLSRYSLIGPYLEKIEVVDEYEVKFVLSETYGPILNALAHPGNAIISSKSIDEHYDRIDDAPVGTGPFKFKEWVPGDYLEYEVYEEYWGEKAKINKLVFKTVQENSSRVVMLENGEADVIDPIPISDIERLNNDSNVSVNEVPSNEFLYVGINNKSDVLTDKRVRQALNYAIDKEQLVDKIFQGYSKVSTAAIAEGTWGHSDVGSYPYDIEKAKELLAEAGVKEGTKLRLWTTDGNIIMDRQVAEYLQNSIQQIGFEVELSKFEIGSYLDALNDENAYDLYLRAGGPPTNDADWVLRALLTTDNFNNNSNFSNEKVDELIFSGVHEPDIGKREAIYSELLEVLKDEAPWIYLNETALVYGTGKDVKDVIMLSTGILEFRNAYKE